MATRSLRRLAAAVPLAAMLAVAGCAADDTSATGTSERGTATPAETPQRGGQLSMIGYAEPTGLDPAVFSGSGSAGATELAAIYDVIMRYDPGTRTYEPRTAESLTPSADFREWTLKLKPGIRFSDGTAYDADAVVFSMRRLTKASAPVAPALAPIKDYVVVDPLTVKFEMAYPYSNMPFVLSYAGMVVSPTAVRAACGEGDAVKPRDCSFNTNPVGAGPFMLQSYKPKESLQLKRNPNYWGGDPYLDGLQVTWTAQDPPKKVQLDGGQAQLVFVRDAKTATELEEALGKEKRLLAQPLNMGSAMLMNVGTVTCKSGAPAAFCAGKPDGQVKLDTPTADVRVRQAIAAAIDLRVLNDRMYNGYGNATARMFPDGSQWHDAPPIFEYNPDKAKALVEEVKRETGWDGTLRSVCDKNPTWDAWGLAVQAMLGVVGMKVQLNQLPDSASKFGVLLNQKNNFDITCNAIATLEEAPEVGLTRALQTGAGVNYSNVASPQIDAALKSIREATSQDQKLAGMKALAEAWRSEMPAVPHFAVTELVAWGSRVRGVTPGMYVSVLLDKAWLAG